MALALIFVRNPVSHDARILREARTLGRLGYRVLIVGVVSTRERARAFELEGIPVVRLEPGHGIRRLLRRPVIADTEPEATRTPPGGPPRAREAAAAPARAARLARRLVLTLSFYLQGIRLVLRHRPALVHANDYNTMWIGVAARLFTRARVVYDTHELWPDRNGRPEWRPWLLACEWLFVRIASVAITASPGYAQAMARRYRVAPPTVVRNIPPADSLRDGAATPDRAAIYVGGLTRGRGIEQAIDAIARVDGVALRLLGPGHPEYLDELRERARRAGLDGRLELLEPVAPEEVVAHLRGALFGVMLIQPVCLSYALTLPNKLFEYAAAGLPMLASDLPVIGAIVRAEGLGEVVPPGDVEAIAAGARRLAATAGDPDVRQRVSAFARRETWEDEEAKLAALYGPPSLAGPPSSR